MKSMLIEFADVLVVEHDRESVIKASKKPLKFSFPTRRMDCIDTSGRV